MSNPAPRKVGVVHVDGTANDFDIWVCGRFLMRGSNDGLQITAIANVLTEILESPEQEAVVVAAEVWSQYQLNADEFGLCDAIEALQAAREVKK